MLNVVIADSFPLFREGVKSLLAERMGLSVVATTENGQGVYDACQRTQVHMVFVECSLAGLDGVLVTRILKANMPSTKVLVVCNCGGNCLEQVIADNVDGYILKDSDPDELCYAVRCILDGGFFISPSVARRLASLCRKGWQLEEHVVLGWKLLTKREKEVLRLVAEGYRNKEIATLLIVSEKTVEKHRANFMRKLALHSFVEIRAFAETMGVPLRYCR